MMARTTWLVLLVLLSVFVGCRDKDLLEVKVRTDFAAGDHTFEDGLNSGIEKAQMKKDYQQNLVVITFDFDTARTSSDPRRSAGLLYRASSTRRGDRWVIEALIRR